MRDALGRDVRYLRLSLTDLCNLRCTYCMPETGVVRKSHDAMLRFEETERVVRALAGLGIRVVKITGGEPLVKRGAVDLIRRIKAVPGIEDVTLTTNGILLKQYAADLAATGISAVNISLDTLDPETYRSITRCGNLQDVLDGIAEIQKYPDITVKLNAVLDAPSPETVLPLVDYAVSGGLILRFIEMMPVGPVSARKKNRCVQDEAAAIIAEKYGKLTPTTRRYGNGPAHYYTTPDGAVIGFISALSHQFCADCDRLRLTSDGHLKNCLFTPETEDNDIKTLLRAGADDAALTEALRRIIHDKPAAHHLNETGAQALQMSGVGG